MTLRPSGPRATLLAGLVAATSLTLVAPLAPAAQAAGLSAPGGLAVANKNSSTPIFSWTKVKKATAYQVQVDNDPSFGSPEFSVSTVNSRAVPTSNLRPGENHWRVRATLGKETSSWVGGSLTVSPVGVPVPTAPGNGAALAQPQSPPLLRWEGVQGATSYSVEVDGDEDFIGAKAYSTKTTSLVVPDPLAIGDWYWRVTAVKAAGIVSSASATSRFDIQALVTPTLTYPPNDVNLAIEDVVFDWTPVAGARGYDLQVALDSGFNNIALNVTNAQSSRYSPPTTLNSDQFWWRVRAVDLAGQSTPWAQSNFGFQRQWPDKPAAVFPTGVVGSPSAYSTTAPYYQWTPAQHATHYELYTANDVNFSVGVDKCEVVGTTYTPRNDGDCGFHATGTTFWRVRPIDAPYPQGTGLPGIFSDVQAFTWSGWAPVGTQTTNYQPVENLKIAVDGTGLDGANNCSLDLCDGTPTTPVLSWDPQPGITSYQVYVAQDENFTTTELPSIPVTQNTRLALRLADNVATLPESQAGGAYYWYVRPCNSLGCGPSPVSQDPPLTGAKAFRKASPAVTGLQSSDPSLSEITFSWQDYWDTNQATVWNGLKSNQTAKNYRLQVDTDPSFSGSLIDDRTVDQTTYTAFDRLYPEGTLYWRVQAKDFENFGLTWSEVRSFTKSSPPVQPTSPGHGATVAGTTPFTWAPQAFASSYTIEVYRNNDAAFSPANRLFVATVKTSAYAWNQPVPADPQPYVWRVRKTDADGNVGPWSATHRFTSLGAVPQPLTPGNSTWQPTAGPLFEWSEVPGAASYSLIVRAAGSTSNLLAVATVATAYAPVKALGTGDYVWWVAALDAGGKVLGTSPTRSFSVDATPPAIKKVKPGIDKLKPKSLILVVFTEAVTGVTKKSLYVTLEGKKKRLKAKVTMNKAKTKATVNVKPRFRASKTYVLHATTKIKDLRGNTLAGGE